MKEKAHSFELIEPANPEALMPHSGISLWWGAVGVSILLLILLVWIAWKRKRATIHPSTFRNTAHAEAARSLSNLSFTDTRNTAIQCSLILRRYLSIVTGDPLLYQTHEEFISRHDALVNLSASARNAAEIGFSRLSCLKYAQELPTKEADEIITESRALLETLHNGFTA